MKKDNTVLSIADYWKEIKQSRFAVSQFCFRQLQRDHIRFEHSISCSFSNDFISRIIINYIAYSQEHSRTELEKNILDLMIPGKSFHTVSVKFYKGILTLTNEMRNRLSFFHFNNKMVKKGTFYFKSNKFFSYILECYAGMTLAEREIIYCYEQYRMIMENTDRSRPQSILKINYANGQVYEMKPYLCIMDDNVFSYYVIGYSRPYGSEEAFKCVSNSLSRIVSCQPAGEKFSLDSVEIRKIKRLHEQVGAAYIFPGLDPEQIKQTLVILTKKGYEDLFLRKITYQRPIPVTVPEKETKDGKIIYKLTFDCSHKQLENYFSAFGEDKLAIRREYADKPMKKKGDQEN